MRSAEAGAETGRRPGVSSLRGRIVFAFALGAGLVSLVLVVSVFAIGRSYMESQRGRAAERLTAAHAELLRAGLGDSTRSAPAMLNTVPVPPGNVLLLRWDGRWLATEPGLVEELVRAADGLESADSGVHRASVAGRPYLLIGLPLPGNNVFYEFASIGELESTLQIMRNLLLACAIAATAVGAAVGVWASRRVLKPLRQVAGTAARVATGDLDLRLPRTRDRDLSVTVDAFNSMVSALQERIDRERRLVGDVGHELRTPLTTLVTSVEVLSRYDSAMPDRARRALGLVSAEVEHLRRLLDDMLALARVEAGIHRADAEPLSVAALLTHTLARRRYPAELLEVRQDSTVHGRKLELERAVANLLSNADRHGGGPVAVTLDRDGDEAVITVDDDGPGVSTQHRERIFARFATAGTNRRTTAGGGTGIGLALVAETVAAHGGRAECGDRPGGGARFTLRLPCR